MRAAPLGVAPRRRRTFPWLQLDGERIGDSTRIIAVPGAGVLRRTALKLAAIPTGVVIRRYYGVDGAAVQRAWELIDAGIDRFRRELRPGGYLAGDGFSVADLTFTALVGAAVQPPGFP